MAISLDGTAPYAPTSAIVEVINRHRNGILQSPVTLQTLERLGVSESIRPRTLQALKLLDLTDEDGNLTPEFQGLRKVPTPEFLPSLATMLRATYAEVFAIVDPSNATFQQVHDAFRGFSPAGQIDRMVWLFLGLLEFTQQWPNLPSRTGSKGAGDTCAKAARTATSERSARRRPKPPSTPPPSLTPPPANEPPSDMRRAYFDLLIKKAEATDDADPELLDRIERLVGIGSDKGAAKD